jgi:hypothetical protein
MHENQKLTHGDSLLAHGRYCLLGQVDQQSVPEIGVAYTFIGSYTGTIYNDVLFRLGNCRGQEQEPFPFVSLGKFFASRATHDRLAIVVRVGDVEYLGDLLRGYIYSDGFSLHDHVDMRDVEMSRCRDAFFFMPFEAHL